MSKEYMKKMIWILVVLVVGGYNVTAQEINQQEYVNKYKDNVQKIIKAVMKDSSAFDRLAYMCDTFGPRLSGSLNLEKALEWAIQEMKKDGLENVQSEEVMVPHWVRNNEFCEMVSPRYQKIPMLAIGGSIATPNKGLEAPILVVSGYDELRKHGDEAKGKIVIFNEPFENYGQAVQYRGHGADSAAKYGAVASLIRPATPMSMKNPHTGMLTYGDSLLKIPHASISSEDAEMLHRMYERGQNPILRLHMECQTLPDTISHNIMCEIKGSEKPDEIISIGGHSDSWDVGLGADDDASGCISGWHAVKILKELGLKPRRTIRAVFWTNEENGLKGGRKYAELHGKEKHVMAFEFDSGVFPPNKIQVSDSILKICKNFEPLLKMVSDTMKVTNGGWGVDILPLIWMGVPSMSLNTSDRDRYFWYHHSPTDYPDKINPYEFNQCIAAIAVAVYLFADLPIELKTYSQK